MCNAGPYESPDERGPNSSDKVDSPSKARAALTGFVIGAVLPVGYGVYGKLQHYAYVASLGPDQGACGMGAVSALGMIFVVGPFCGAIGSVLGWARQWAVQ